MKKILLLNTFLFTASFAAEIEENKKNSLLDDSKPSVVVTHAEKTLLPYSGPFERRFRRATEHQRGGFYCGGKTTYTFVKHPILASIEIGKNQAKAGGININIELHETNIITELKTSLARIHAANDLSHSKTL